MANATLRGHKSNRITILQQFAGVTCHLLSGLHSKVIVAIASNVR
ncbi:hypothetical protein [Anabaena sphaerica]|nr:hypothetical protein [Anabaena sphaerica]